MSGAISRNFPGAGRAGDDLVELPSVGDPRHVVSSPRKTPKDGGLGLVDRARAVVLRLDHVPAMDRAGLVALESALAELQQRGTLVAITGLQRNRRQCSRTPTSRISAMAVSSVYSTWRKAG